MLLFNNVKYIIDSGPFIDLNKYPPDVFDTLWTNLEEMFHTNEIISSIEVYREIKDYNDEYVAEWSNRNKKYFFKPTIEEQAFVSDILEEFPNLIKQSAILTGRPQADPFVIAQAKFNDAILVHTETVKPHAHKIPNVCNHYNIEEISLFDFFRKEKWKF